MKKEPELKGYSYKYSDAWVQFLGKYGGREFIGAVFMQAGVPDWVRKRDGDLRISLGVEGPDEEVIRERLKQFGEVKVEP